MTAGEIFIAVALKGALLTFLQMKGWLPSPEEYGKRKQQERLMLKSYRLWRKQAGPDAAEALHATLEARTKRPRKFRATGQQATQ